MGNLLVWIFVVTNVLAQSLPPRGHGGGTDNYDSPFNNVPDYGTNLWLSINLSNDAVHLLLHNTHPGVPYLIRSREDLTSGSWFYEETVTGAVAGTATSATLNTGEWTNSLFIQALTWTTNAAAGATVMMAMGGERIMELTANGDVISWGGNRYGELGDYTFLDSTNPVHVAGLIGVTKIASGLNHSLALDSNGTLWAWGQNNFGQLGNDQTGNTDAPVQVLGMTNVIAIDAHGYNGEGIFGLSAAVRADGTVWTWGCSECFSGCSYSPAQVAGISNAIAVAIGDCHLVALLTNGTVLVWGNGNEDSVPVPGLSNIVAVCAGDFHTLALASNGMVWAWGYNFYGQLGDGENEYYRDAPVMVVGLTNVIGIAAAGWHSMAVDAQGRLWAWGDDGWGQLGDGGSAGVARRPFQVPGMSNIVALATGTYASAALDGDGSFWQWGGEDGYPRLSPAYVDFYNGQLPDLQILDGNNQTPHAGLEFPQALVFKVADRNGVGLSNAPVSVEVINGDMQLRTVSGGGYYPGFRLTTDGNGEVSLIGYADRYASNPNCLVRVLAASRERVVEADFSETLIPPPTISITTPADGSVHLVGTNQPLDMTVNAQAATGASIEEVDYYYQTNGGANALLGVSTQSPYSITWTNTLWWTNAFVAQYTISAVAVDNGGARSDPQSVNITVALDSDGNGLPDYWELQYFGRLGVDPYADADGDSISNLQEYQQGTDPTDFYNGRLPYLEILGGNDQTGNYDSFLPEPVSIKVSGSQFFDTFIANAPVTFTVTNGTALLAATTNDIPASSLVLRSDSNGRVSARVYFPPSGPNPPDSTILVSAASGASSVAVSVNEFIPLARWRFNDTNTWVGEEGQVPLLAANVTGVASWSSNAVSVDNVNPALLSYNAVEANGRTNINCQTGSALFWFKPDWRSASVGGNGPGTWGRLIEMGSYNPAFTNGWWGLYLSPDGTQLLFGTSTNGGGMTNLTASISWYSNEWYQIVLTCSPARSALYVDGQLLANGAGVSYFPNAGELTTGFRIGSDQDGNNQAAGAFDELETFNYPLAAANTATYSSQIPDWWEIEYFGQAGMNPDFQPSNDGISLLIDYQRGRYPNVINFSLTTTNGYVANGLVPVQIHLQGGVPFGLAVAVNTTNFVVVPNQLFDISSNFITTPWQPYNSNIVVSLNSGDGDYYVWVGLKGLSPDAEQTWQGTRLTLDTVPPILTITNPANGIVSRPIIQMQGCANESLSSLTYDVSNASGVWTNLTGYVTGQFCDTNLLAITTNYFQCYNIALTSNGVNFITLHAADLAGNTTTTNFNFRLDASADTNPPALTVIWPQSGTYVSGSNFTLQAQVSDPMSTVTASIVDANGDTNTVQGLVEQSGLVWVQDLPLASNVNMLTVTATDAVGNTSATNLTLFQSSVIVTMNPLAGDQFNQSSVSVSGTISDPSYTLTVNGMSATVNSDGTWGADNVPVSLSGTAIFDVEVYSGSAPNLIRANLTFAPHDAPSGGNDGSQLFALTLPVKVGLMSYLSGTASYGVIAGGRYCAVDPCCGPAFCNNGDTVNWTYQAGGSDTGYYYSSGYYNSGPGSPGWLMLCAPQNSAWDNPLPAGNDAYGAPWENISDAQYYFRTHVMIEPPGQAAAGTTVIYLVQAQAWAVNGGGQLPADWLKICGVTLTDDGTGSGYMLLSAPAGVNVDVTPTAPGNYTFNVQATELDIKLAVDNNRDGDITFDAADQTTTDRPYRFWVNNDYDGYDGSIDDYTDLDPSTGSDAVSLYIDCPRNLEDFTRLWINTQGITEQLQSGTFLLALEWEDTTDDPQLRLFQAVESNGGALYLTDTNVAQQQIALPYGKQIIEYRHLNVLTKYNPYIFPVDFWSNVSADAPVAHLLFEAVSRGSGELVLSIYKNDAKTKLAESQPIYLDLKDVKEMYERWTVGSDPSSAPATTASPVSSPYPYNSAVPAEGNYILFVHGWNMAPWEKDAFADTAFKRLWWQGYKGRFGAFQWPTEYGFSGTISAIADADNYDNSESNAWASATGLLGKLNDLNAEYPGHVYMFAHSMGNVVAGEALRLAGTNQVVNTYVAMQAAIPSHAYDPTTYTRTNNLNYLGIGYNSHAPNCYASYWTGGAPCYFDGTVGAGSYINFYNQQDWALARWEVDQDFKPDFQAGYAYDASKMKFTKNYSIGTELDFPLNTCEIFAYCDTAFCYALGEQAFVGGRFQTSQQVNLDLTFGFGNTHTGHSKEFNSDNMSQAAFWNTLLGKMRLLP